mmetsp:Transcript_2863/g.6415  ORF Transcript_2863/g.6415 Transcript_2863/m.6415 type:complete len:592 (-) Transcript_2863:436-2211(-)
MKGKGSEMPRRQVTSLSLEERTSSEPFQNRKQLYIMHFFFAFVSRMWDMGIVLLVAQLTNNSLFLVAVTGLLSALAVFLFMTTIGAWLDKTNRITAVRVALSVKCFAVSGAYMICAYLNTIQPASSGPTGDAFDTESDTDTDLHLLLYSLPLLGAVAKLSFCAITQSIEKDWVVVLSNRDSNWLATTNSFMTQIDLACSSLAPALTGVLFACLSHADVSLILLGVNAAAAFTLYLFMNHVYSAWPALGMKVGVDVLQASDLLDEDVDTGDAESSRTSVGGGYAPSPTRHTGASGVASNRMSVDAQMLNKLGDNGAMGLDNSPTAQDTTLWSYLSCLCPCCLGPSCSYFDDFMSSGCVGVMVSYAALYLTVLSFGSLMTVYVRWAGVSDDYIGVFRGLSALFGYTGAVIFPYFKEHFGLQASGQVAIVYQFLLVVVAASSHFWASVEVSVYVIIVAVLLSRTGLWLFDLCARQIAQETIPEAVRGRVNGQWRSMIAFFEMASYFIALFVPDPRDFWVLTSVSAGMIGFALVVYTATNTGTWGRGGNRDAGGYSAVAVAETCRYESPTKNSTNPAASISPFAGQRGQGGQGGQ